jgi:hypothetical protein
MPFQQTRATFAQLAFFGQLLLDVCWKADHHPESTNSDCDFGDLRFRLDIRILFYQPLRTLPVTATLGSSGEGIPVYP